ncbi:hypothetical protein GCM10027294_40440 [Marinactinospora endophytica]
MATGGSGAGHWEGDLIAGTGSRPAIGPWPSAPPVRDTGPPSGHSAAAVRDALVDTAKTLPTRLKRSPTWDQDPEMAAHTAFTLASAIPVFFRDPAGPWQRGSNENTNGLLRRSFLKGSDLSVHSRENLETVAAEPNSRPREALGRETSAERLAKLLDTQQPAAVLQRPRNSPTTGPSALFDGTGRAAGAAGPRFGHATAACADGLVRCVERAARGATAVPEWRGRPTMQASEVSRAVAAAMSIASSLGLAVDDAIVLHDSNRLTLRLLPCDVLARVALVAHQVARFEVELAQRLAESGCPVAALDPRVEPRVYERAGFVVTLWVYYPPVPSQGVSPADYADALERLHAGMRELDVPTPRFTDRVEQAQRLVADHERTPALSEPDRELLGGTLESLKRAIGERGGAEQPLHGEPHPGNVLTTGNGLLFIDLETCCRGPVEFDLAHAPEEVGRRYPGVDHDLLRACRILVPAMITTWRWDRDDRLPDGRRLGTEWLGRIRAALGPNSLDLHG